MDLAHVHAGSGPPLVLVHGIGMSSAAWSRVVPLLAEDHECFAVDLPGFGASPPLRGPASMAALGRACAAFMTARGHARFAVAGNSLGGGVALWLALGGVATAACGLSPIGFAHGWDRVYLHVSLAGTRAITPVARRLVAAAGGSGAVRRAVLTQSAQHGERVTAEELAHALEVLRGSASFGSAQRHAINWRCPAVEGDPPCPVTVAWGEKDRLLLRRPQAGRARARLPRARHLVLEGAGHLPAWDDPGRVAQVVRDAVRAAPRTAARA